MQLCAFRHAPRRGEEDEANGGSWEMEGKFTQGSFKNNNKYVYLSVC